MQFYEIKTKQARGKENKFIFANNFLFRKTFYRFVKNYETMSEILNISAIKNKMKDQPPGQQLYSFFAGGLHKVTVSQIKEAKKIIDAEHKKTTKFLDNAINSANK